jgi:hypothetical protein
MNDMKGVCILGIGLTVALAACAPASTPSSSLAAALQSNAPYAPSIDPASFTTDVDNPYFPLRPGTRWVLTGSGDTEGEVTTTTVTHETREVMGVTCVVVHDEVAVDGTAIEITDDWYAQDADGNVWYFGEETAEYEDGKVTSTAGSWEAGIDGAQPGIIMPADPQPDVTYRQEFLAGEAEDMAKVVELRQSVTTPAGTYDDVLVTEDWTPLEPDVREQKFYARDVGLVRELLIEGGSAESVLTELSGG